MTTRTKLLRDIEPCTCPTCMTAEQRAAYLRQQEAERLVRFAAFERYWQDRLAGRPLRTPEYYRDAVMQEAPIG